MSENSYITEVLPESYGFGSFNTILVKPLSDEFLCPKKVSIEHYSLPEANGYWNFHGREHKIFYKKKLIASLLTEDCGLGSAKARAYLKEKGFKIA